MLAIIATLEKFIFTVSNNSYFCASSNPSNLKTTYLLVVACFMAATATAQFDPANFSASLSGNYTMYKGDFGKSTPGAKIDIGYSLTEKARISVGYTYHAPIKIPSSISATNGMDTKTISSEVKYKFSTISLTGSYTFIKTEEDPISIYTPIGVSYVSVKYSETGSQSIPAGYTAVDQLEPGKESGFTINVGLGAQYNMGSLRIFLDGGVALPANQANGQYVVNNIPAHFVFNAGIRIPFGTRDFE